MAHLPAGKRIEGKERVREEVRVMRRMMRAAGAAALVILLAGCNPEDVNNLKSDTQKLGQDIGPMVSGATLQTKVNLHLTLHKGIDMSRLHIDTKDKTVTVSGHVRDAGMHRRVIDTVRETTGVDKVVDKLNEEK
jgi:osmotically-inducible protein OsmY